MEADDEVVNVHDLAELTWTELDELDRSRLVAVLPVGATEAHGPHLPLATDVIIAGAMARRGAELLAERGATALILPPLAYTVADFAAGFAGTVSVRPETAVAVLADIGASLAAHGVRALVLANAHLDPTHIGSLRSGAERIEAESPLEVAFPDVTRKPWALRLTDEFKSGACHAGRYEGSIVMAARPDIVRQHVARDLAPNPASLSTAIRAGASTFEQAGGPLAYFGAPAEASAAEGRSTIETLGQIVLDCARERWTWLSA